MTIDLNLDVLIVGGGPAGSACAIGLARSGSRTGLLEATDFSRQRVGETVNSRSREQLTRLGMCEQELTQISLSGGRVVSVWGEDREPTCQPGLLNPYGTGWRVDRRAFDKMLFDHAGATGAVCLSSARIFSVKRVSGGWECVIEQPDQRWSCRANTVVEATGRSMHSPFAACQKRLYRDSLYGLGMRVQHPSRHALADCASIESTACGWWYSVMLPGDQLFVAFFTDSDLLPPGKAALEQFLTGQLKQAEWTSDRLPHLTELISQRQWRGFDARTSIRRTPVADGWIAAGDSLLAFDPLSGQGIPESIESGMDVAALLATTEEDYQVSLPRFIERTGARFNDVLERHFQAYRSEFSWPDAEFWRRRH